MAYFFGSISYSMMILDDSARCSKVIEGYVGPSFF